jgi:opacity protein-like surface antigen
MGGKRTFSASPRVGDRFTADLLLVVSQYCRFLISYKSRVCISAEGSLIKDEFVSRRKLLTPLPQPETFRGGAMLWEIRNAGCSGMRAQFAARLNVQRRVPFACLVLAAAVTAVSPAVARDAGPYGGVEGGMLFPTDMRGNAAVHFTGNTLSVCLPGKPLCETVEEDQEANLETKLKRGTDVAGIAGYDFGPIRFEVELGWKRMKREGLEIDPAFLDYLNAVLRRPSPGEGGLTAVGANELDALDGKANAKTVMANLLGDLRSTAGFSIYGGGGLGRVWARALNDRDSAWAMQAIAGVRTPVRRNVEVGLKYRYFRTGSLRFVGGPLEFAGNPFIDFAGGIMFVNQASAKLTPQFTGRLQSHSVLATITFSFGDLRH